MRKGSKQTPESIEKNRLAHLGKKDSASTLQKKRESHLGERNVFFGKHHTEETLEILKRPKSDIAKQHMSEAKKNRLPGNIEILKTSRVGARNSEEQISRQKESLAKPEVKDKMKESHVGDKNINWKNGRTPLTERIRESSRYYEWRNAIYKRDNYTDVTTGERGNGNLNAHHLVPYAEIMDRNNITSYEEAMACEELWDISNGITMIDRNHVKLHMKTGLPE
jgi:hypothetical protein